MAYCCCLLLRGCASAATGSQSPAELPLCTALWVEEVSPVFRHRLDLRGQGTSDCGCGFAPPTTAFRQPLHEVSAIFTTDRVRAKIRFVSGHDFNRDVKVYEQG